MELLSLIKTNHSGLKTRFSKQKYFTVLPKVFSEKLVRPHPAVAFRESQTSEVVSYSWGNNSYSSPRCWAGAQSSQDKVTGVAVMHAEMLLGEHSCPCTFSLYTITNTHTQIVHMAIIQDQWISPLVAIVRAYKEEKKHLWFVPEPVTRQSCPTDCM